MRTTLDIDDDVLLAAKDIARRDKKSLGQVISELARQAFARPTYPPAAALGPAPATAGAAPVALTASERLAAYGIQPLPARGAVVSNELIERLRDAEGI
jgi:hypothetical protein